jgi:beta-lactamase class A
MTPLRRRITTNVHFSDVEGSSAHPTHYRHSILITNHCSFIDRVTTSNVCHDIFVMDLEALFEESGCRGYLQVQSLDGTRQVTLRERDPVVAASVFKVLVALEIECQFAAGLLDPSERCHLRANGRTPGPTGMSLFAHDIDVALGDLVVAMMSISDNVATDAILRRIGINAVNDRAKALGLVDTVVMADLATIVNSIGVDAGFADYDAFTAWWATNPTQVAMDDMSARVRNSTALTASTTNRTTARDMARLLQLIWTDEAGPSPACARVRHHMSGQLTRNRLASGFSRGTTVSAKSGGLMGAVRNEVGAIVLPDGTTYIASVFTQSIGTENREVEINSSIGRAAALAIDSIRDAI